MSSELQPDVANILNGDAAHNEEAKDGIAVTLHDGNEGNEDSVMTETNQTVEEVPHEMAEIVEDVDKPFSWL